MSPLQDQADDGKARELHWKPLLWLPPPPGLRRQTTPGARRFGRLSIWQTFFTSALGLEVPVLSSLSNLPRYHNLPAAKCGCKSSCCRSHTSHSACA